ncbi:MAG: hypothetical protein N2446_03780 [Elusimicrobiales bacterium]|nr:hypothetical protein [Elusimicrobiales bacterium]
MQRAWNKSTRLIFVFSIIFTSCSSVFIDIIKVSPDLEATKNIDLYTSREEIKKPHGAVAVLHSQRFDCSLKLQNRILKKAISIAKKNGGDALVYYFDYREKDLYALPDEKCYFSGLVIKYLTDEIVKKYNIKVE